MKNNERQKQLFALAKQALEVAWPDKIGLIPVKDYRDEPVWDLHFHITRAKDSEVNIVQNCTLPELFQYVAGIVRDYRPDRHYVFDLKTKQFGVVDVVDYTEAELSDRFRPLDPPREGAHYEYRKGDPNDMLALVKKDGTEELYPLR